MKRYLIIFATTLISTVVPICVLGALYLLIWYDHSIHLWGKGTTDELMRDANK
jgi:hypothetical protein